MGPPIVDDRTGRTKRATACARFRRSTRDTVVLEGHMPIMYRAWTAIVLTALFAACSGKSIVDAAPEIDGSLGCVASDAGIMIADNHVHAPHAVTVTSADVQAAAADK